MATDSTNIYVVAAGMSAINKFAISAPTALTVLTGGSVAGYVDGTCAQAKWNQPRGLYATASTLYVSDGINNVVRQVVLSSCQVTTIAGTDSTSGYVDGYATSAKFNFPSGIAPGSNACNCLYVSDTSNNAIRKITLTAGAYTVSTIAGGNAVSGLSFRYFFLFLG